MGRRNLKAPNSSIAKTRCGLVTNRTTTTMCGRPSNKFLEIDMKREFFLALLLPFSLSQPANAVLPDEDFQIHSTPTQRKLPGIATFQLQWRGTGGYGIGSEMWSPYGWGTKYLTQFGLKEFQLSHTSVLVAHVKAQDMSNKTAQFATQYLFNSDRTKVCILDLLQVLQKTNGESFSFIHGQLIECHAVFEPLFETPIDVSH